jgi:hypothetical protein
MSSKATKDDPEILNGGYAVAGPETSTAWTCARRFHDFCERFGTVVSEAADDPRALRSGPELIPIVLDRG